MTASNLPVPTSFEFIPELKKAWQQVDGAKLTFFVLLLILLAAFVILSKVLPQQPPLSSAAFSDILQFSLRSAPGAFAYYFFYIGFIYLGIKRMRGEAITLNDFGSVYSSSQLRPVLIFALVMMLLHVVSGVIGLVLGLYVMHLLVPVFLVGCVYIWLRLYMAPFLIADPLRQYDAKRAIQASWQQTSGNVFTLFVAVLIMCGLSFVAVLTLMIGYIWILPLMTIYSARVYGHLADRQTIA